MVEFAGEYGMERRLWSAPGFEVWSARAPLADDCSAAVKIVRAEGAGPLLEQALDQRLASEQNTNVVAPIHDHGRLSDGSAYLVTDRRSSLEDLIALRVRIDAVTLARLTGGVIDALLAFRAGANRDHGALGASNVLVDTGPPSDRWRAMVCDPLPRRLLTPRAALDDTRALGGLIRDLVEHTVSRTDRERSRDLAWGALGGVGKAWRALADELISAGSPADLDGLRARVRILESKGRAPRRRRRAGGVLAAVCLLGAIGAGVVYAMMQDGHRRAQFDPDEFRRWCNVSYLWVGGLESAIEREREVFEADPVLRDRVLAVYDRATDRKSPILLDPEDLRGEFFRAAVGEYLPVLSQQIAEDEKNSRFGGRVVEALEVIDEIAAGLEAWGGLGIVEDSRVLFAEQGWRRPELELTLLADRCVGFGESRLVPEPDAQGLTQAAPVGRRTLLELIEVSTSVAELETLWPEIEGRGDEIESLARAIPALAGTADVIRSFESRPDDRGSAERTINDLLVKVADLDTLTRGVLTFLDSGWSDVDTPYLAHEWGKSHTGGIDSVERLGAWFGLASSEGVTKLDPEADPRLTYDGADGFNGVRSRLEGLRAEYGETFLYTHTRREGLGERTAQGADAAGELADLEWDRLREARVREGFAALETELEALREKAAAREATLAGAAASWSDALRASDGVSELGSPTIDGAWRGARDELLARLDAGEAFGAVFADVERTRTIMRGVDGRLLPLVGDVGPSSLDRAALDARRREILETHAAGVIESLVWDRGGATAPVGFEALLRGLEGEARDWGVRATSILEEAETIEGMLDEAFRIDEPGEDGLRVQTTLGSWRTGEVASDDGLRGALAALIERAEALEAIELENEPAALRAALGGADPGGPREVAPEIALAAYDRIGEGVVTWDRGEFETELEDRAQAEDVASRVEPESRSRALLERIGARARARWAGFAGGVGNRDELRLASETRRESSGEIGDLGPRGRFNIEVHEFVGSLDLDAGEDELRARAGALLARLPDEGSLADQAAVRFLREIETAATPPNDGLPSLRARDFGPGGAGWDADDVDGGEELWYWWPDRAAPQHTIVFRRVPVETDVSPTGRAYVAAKELDLGLMCHVFEQSPSLGDELKDSWIQLNNAMGKIAWSGPRGWRWDSDQNRTVINERWLADKAIMTREEARPYPEGLRDGSDPMGIAASAGGSPTDRHPAQHVSPAAGRAIAEALGCRLPTEGEWLAAWRHAGLGAGGAPAGGGAGANLRDRTYETQTRWVERINTGVLSEGGEQYVYPDFLSIAGEWRGESKPPTGAGAQSGAQDDGVLWFGPVDGGGDAAGFAHLAGNVAEMVTMGMTSNGKREMVGAIGGSSLWPPEWPQDSAQPVSGRSGRMSSLNERKSNSDVGLRLAVEVPEGRFRMSVRRRLERLQEEIPWQF